MGNWVIYASPEQDNVSNWNKFETMLERSGLSIACDRGMKPDSKTAFIYVSDPKKVFDDPSKGLDRLLLVARRVRALISNWSVEPR